MNLTYISTEIKRYLKLIWCLKGVWTNQGLSTDLRMLVHYGSVYLVIVNHSPLQPLIEIYFYPPQNNPSWQWVQRLMDQMLQTEAGDFGLIFLSQIKL